jgi:hypothetical protein
LDGSAVLEILAENIKFFTVSYRGQYSQYSSLRGIAGTIPQGLPHYCYSRPVQSFEFTTVNKYSLFSQEFRALTLLIQAPEQCNGETLRSSLYHFSVLCEFILRKRMALCTNVFANVRNRLAFIFNATNRDARYEIINLR